MRLARLVKLTVRWIALAAGTGAGVAGVASPAAAQSLYGPGGLFLHPTAVLPPEGVITPAVLVLPQSNGLEGGRTTNWISGSLDYGLLPEVEIGATVVKVTDWPGREKLSGGGFGKYLLMAETAHRPAIAAGGTWLTGGRVDTQIAFIAARKRLRGSEQMQLFGDVGVQYAGNIDGIGRHDFQPYAGLELGVSPEVTLVGEARPRLTGDVGTPLALSIVGRLAEDYQVAVTWANNGLSTTPRFGFGVGLSLGYRR